MKTKFNLVVSIMLFCCLSTSIFGQNEFTADASFNDGLSVFSFMNVEDFNEGVDLYTLDEKVVTLDYLETNQDPAEVVAYALTMIAFGAGFGFISDQTLWCLHAAYYLRLAMYTKSALFAAAGVVYNGLSGDNLNSSLIDFQLKLLMFTAITRYNQVRLIYGLLLGYGLGSDTFNSNFKSDITRITAALVMGFHILLTAQWSIMFQTNIFAYQSQTIKPDSGGEIKDNTTWGLINKNNLLALSLVWTLKNSRR